MPCLGHRVEDPRRLAIPADERDPVAVLEIRAMASPGHGQGTIGHGPDHGPTRGEALVDTSRRERLEVHALAVAHPHGRDHVAGSAAAAQVGVAGRTGKLAHLGVARFPVAKEPDVGAVEQCGERARPVRRAVEPLVDERREVGLPRADFAPTAHGGPHLLRTGFARSNVRIGFASLQTRPRRVKDKMRPTLVSAALGH